MEAVNKERRRTPRAPDEKQSGKRLPHERDETTRDNNEQHTRSVIRQAAEDIEQGLVDTDLHGKPGLQKPRPDSQARPLPGTRRD